MEELTFEIEHGELIAYIKDLVEITRNTVPEKVIFSTEAQRKIHALFDEFNLSMIDETETEGMFLLRYNPINERVKEND